MPQVGIGDGYLDNIRSQYADWRLAFAREAFQNSVDSPGATHVAFSVRLDAIGDTVVEFSNDGESIPADAIRERLFTLGGTGKAPGRAVGGFGRAKELLYFSAVRYEIESGETRAKGEGVEYEISACKRHKGTRSVVTLFGDCRTALLAAFRRVVGYSDFRGKVTIDGEAYERRTLRGRSVSWGGGEGWTRTYRPPGNEGAVIVRVAGVFQFAVETPKYPGLVVVEVDNPEESLTASRDSLRWPYSRALAKLVHDLQCLPSGQAFSAKPTITLIGGSRLTGASDPVVFDRGIPEFRLWDDPGSRLYAAYYDPNSPRFTGYAKWLLESWANSLIALHAMLGSTREFAIGFSFVGRSREDAQDSGYAIADGVPTFYASPCLPASKTARWSRRDRWGVFVSAAKAYVRSEGFDAFDEAFHRRFAEVMEVAFRQRVALPGALAGKKKL